MIQRIQTVWWIASAAALAALFFLPLFNFENGDFVITKNCMGLTITIGITILVSIINIFLYTNRMLQVRIGYGLIFLNLMVGFFIGVHYYLDKGTQLLPWITLPLVSLILQILAMRAVKKDEALIKSMDRLR